MGSFFRKLIGGAATIFGGPVGAMAGKAIMGGGGQQGSPIQQALQMGTAGFLTHKYGPKAQMGGLDPQAAVQRFDTEFAKGQTMFTEAMEKLLEKKMERQQAEAASRGMLRSTGHLKTMGDIQTQHTGQVGQLLMSNIQQRQQMLPQLFQGQLGAAQFQAGQQERAEQKQAGMFSNILTMFGNKKKAA